MSRRRPTASRSDRAKAALGAIAVNLFLGVAFVTGLALNDEQRRDEILETFDIRLPPPEPPPAVEPDPEDAAAELEGAAGRKAEPSPVVAAPSPIPRPSPLAAAPTPGTGSASTSGAAAGGTGPGAGGSGSGGGGGQGGIGSEARLLGGNRARLPARLLRTIPQSGGYAHLLLSVGTQGRVTGCEVLTSSGWPAIDGALCSVMVRNSRWEAARDRSGRPIEVQVRYTATWSKN